MTFKRREGECVAIKLSVLLWRSGARDLVELYVGCKEFRAFLTQFFPLHGFDTVVLMQIHR